MSIYRVITCLLLLTLLPACKDDKTGLQSGDPTDFKQAVLINKYGITSISISAKNAILKTGATQQYTAVGNTDTGSTVDITTDVSWSVSNSTAATIDENGLVTALAPGDVTVTAQLSTYSADTDLRVTSANVSGITITEADGTTDFTVDACKRLQLKAVASYSGETFTADVSDKVTWSTGNLSADVAHFSTNNSEKGLLLTSAVNNNINISATLGSVTTRVTVTTTDGFSSLAANTAITINPNSAVIESSSDTKQFSASANFDDGTSADITRSAIWSSDDDAIVSVSNSPGSKGLVSAHAVGSTTINAGCGNNQSQTASVEVSNPSLTSISIDYDNALTRGTDAGGDIVYLNIDDTLQLDAIAHYADDSTATVTTDANWEIFPSDSNVVTISTDGLVTANALGTALVKVTYNEKTQTLTITVR